jgi:hypothetical protein
MEALGRLFDISAGVAPVDINTADAATGKRVSLKNASGVTILLFTGVQASAGTADLVVDVQQATAATGGTSNDLDSTNGATGIDHFYVKSATALAGTETWARVVNNSGTPVSEVTVAGATYGATQIIVAIEVAATQLADGFCYISANLAETTANAQLLGVLYVVHDLDVQRKPANLPAALA